MRAIFLLLVLANILLFAYGQGYFGRPGGGGEPARLDAQITPERLVIVARGHHTHAAAPPAAPVPAPPEICREAAGLTPEQALKLAELARPHADRLRLSRDVAEEGGSWWVFLPPQRSRQANEVRVAELRRLGISEYYVVPDEGPNQFAISLGVFKSERKAAEALDALQRKGLKGAQMAVRDVASRVRLQFTGTEAVLRALSDQAAAELAGVTLAECTPPR